MESSVVQKLLKSFFIVCAAYLRIFGSGVDGGLQRCGPPMELDSLAVDDLRGLLSQGSSFFYQDCFIVWFVGRAFLYFTSLHSQDPPTCLSCLTKRNAHFSSPFSSSLRFHCPSADAAPFTADHVLTRWWGGTSVADVRRFHGSGRCEAEICLARCQLVIGFDGPAGAAPASAWPVPRP